MTRNLSRDRNETGETQAPSQSSRQPYDSSAIRHLPHPLETDPPYRHFWIDSQGEDGGEGGTGNVP